MFLLFIHSFVHLLCVHLVAINVNWVTSKARKMKRNTMCNDVVVGILQFLMQKTYTKCYTKLLKIVIAIPTFAGKRKSVDCAKCRCLVDDKIENTAFDDAPNDDRRMSLQTEKCWRTFSSFDEWSVKNPWSTLHRMNLIVFIVFIFLTKVHANWETFERVRCVEKSSIARRHEPVNETNNNNIINANL